MPIFQKSYYRLGENQFYDTEGYKSALIDKLRKQSSKDEQAAILHNEVIEITLRITNGIRDLIRQDRRISNLVLNQGAIPLATWADSLDNWAIFSLRELKYKIHKMKQELENGHVEGLPGTMFLKNKPTFTTFEGFYNIIFDLAEDFEIFD